MKKGESENCSHPPNSSKVMMVDLNASGRQEMKSLELNGELEIMQIGSKPNQSSWINKNLPMSLEEELVTFLRKNVDLFVWIAADMPENDPKFMCHHLATFPSVRPVAQKRRKMSLDRALKVQKQVPALLDVDFIREVMYPT